MHQQPSTLSRASFNRPPPRSVPQPRASASLGFLVLSSRASSFSSAFLPRRTVESAPYNRRENFSSGNFDGDACTERCPSPDPFFSAPAPLMAPGDREKEELAGRGGGNKFFDDPVSLVPAGRANDQPGIFCAARGMMKILATARRRTKAKHRLLAARKARTKMTGNNEAAERSEMRGLARRRNDKTFEACLKRDETSRASSTAADNLEGGRVPLAFSTSTAVPRASVAPRFLGQFGGSFVSDRSSSPLCWQLDGRRGWGSE